MPSLKQVCIVLLRISNSLARVTNVRTKCMSLNDESCVVRSTVIDLNAVELKYFLFIIRLDECSGIYDVLSPKICVPKNQKTKKKTKDINVKVFNMIKNNNEAKTMRKRTSCDCK